jgi:hypothetical protein
VIEGLVAVHESGSGVVDGARSRHRSSNPPQTAPLSQGNTASCDPGFYAVGVATTATTYGVNTVRLICKQLNATLN